MSNNQKWIKELSDFFAKDENWDIACETIEAVERVETYWKEQFWLNVYQQCCEQLDENLWAVRRDGEQVDIDLKYDKYRVEESCCIMISCDEEDGCSYGIWIDQDDYKHSQHKEFANFSEAHGLAEGDGCFYRPQVAPYLESPIGDP